MSRSESVSPPIRAVRGGDRAAIQELIQPHVDRQRLLERTLDELDNLMACGYVAEDAGRVVGFAALEVYSSKLAEIRSLAVEPTYQGRGVGRRLVEACLEEARRRHVLEVMAISSLEDFFRTCGFEFTLPGEKKAFFFSTQQHREPG